VRARRAAATWCPFLPSSSAPRTRRLDAAECWDLVGLAGEGCDLAHPALPLPALQGLPDDHGRCERPVSVQLGRRDSGTGSQVPAVGP
jgi:hypothetical protein